MARGLPVACVAGVSTNTSSGFSHGPSCALDGTWRGACRSRLGRPAPCLAVAAITIAATCLQLYPTGQVHSPSSNARAPSGSVAKNAAVL